MAKIVAMKKICKFMSLSESINSSGFTDYFKPKSDIHDVASKLDLYGTKYANQKKQSYKCPMTSIYCTTLGNFALCATFGCI